jgi:hypothetical protein
MLGRQRREAAQAYAETLRSDGVILLEDHRGEEKVA